MFRLSFMFIALLTAGCVSLDPHYDRPTAPVPATLPGAHGESTAVVGDWQKVVNDARLKKVIPTDKAEGIREYVLGNIRYTENVLRAGIPKAKLSVCLEVLEQMSANLTGNEKRREEIRDHE